MKAEIEILSDILQLAKFPTRELAAEARKYVDALSSDVHAAGYEPPTPVTKQLESLKSAIDSYYDSLDADKQARLKKQLEEIDNDES